MIPVVQLSCFNVEAELHTAPCIRQSRQADYLERLLSTADWVNYLSRVARSCSGPFSCGISYTRGICGSGKVGHCCSSSSCAVPQSGESEVEPRMSALATLSHSRYNSSVGIEWHRSVDASSEK